MNRQRLKYKILAHMVEVCCDHDLGISVSTTAHRFGEREDVIRSIMDEMVKEGMGVWAFSNVLSYNSRFGM